MRPPHSASFRRVLLQPGGRLTRVTAVIETSPNGELPAVLVDPRNERGSVMSGLWLLGGRDKTLGADAYGRIEAAPVG